jgi:hypothetical protein
MSKVHRTIEAVWEIESTSLIVGIASLRRGRMLEQKHSEIARELEFQQQRLSEA